jgi:hypothetical protein
MLSGSTPIFFDNVDIAEISSLSLAPFANCSAEDRVGCSIRCVSTGCFFVTVCTISITFSPIDRQFSQVLSYLRGYLPPSLR